MLNEVARKKAEKLLRLITLEEDSQKVLTSRNITVDDVEWLALTLLETDNRAINHRDCCLPDKESCAYKK